MRRRMRPARWVFVLFLVAAIAVLIFPVYWTFLSSVTSVDRVLSTQPPLVPKDPSLRAYREVLARKPVLLWLVNTLVVSFGATALSLGLSVPAAYSLSRFRTVGQHAMGYILLLSRMLPGTLLVIPVYMVFARIGWINSYQALILMNMTTIIPFSTWMLKAFFDRLPRELEEAALIDGCGWSQSFLRVLLPLTLPGLASVAIYSLILSWNEYLFARTLVLRQDRWVFSVGLASFIGEHSIDWNNIMAGGILFLFPLMIFFIFLERYLVSGMTSGAVKG